MQVKYGMEGYGLYWYCLELIANDVDEGSLTFELEHDAELISFDTKIHAEVVQEMMTYMVNLGLFECDAGVIRCEKLAKRLDKSMTTNRGIRQMITDMRVESSDYSGYVYFIIAESPSDKKVKIGRSKNPWQRVKEIAKTDDALSYELHVAATMSSTDCVTLETELHRFYKDKNIVNEWFTLDSDILFVIEQIQRKHIKTDVALLRHVVVSPEENRLEEKRIESGAKKRVTFVPPTVNEIADYCAEKGYPIDADRFFNFYESKGWYVGKTKMKSWRAAAANTQWHTGQLSTTQEHIL